MSIVSRRKTTFFFSLFLLSFFFTKFDARRIKLVQFRIVAWGTRRKGGTRTRGKNDELVENERRGGLLARLRWNAYELEECAWKVSGVRKRVPLACTVRGST